MRGAPPFFNFSLPSSAEYASESDTPNTLGPVHPDLTSAPRLMILLLAGLIIGVVTGQVHGHRHGKISISLMPRSSQGALFERQRHRVLQQADPSGKKPVQPSFPTRHANKFRL
jgi:hypothetical protein